MRRILMISFLSFNWIVFAHEGHLEKKISPSEKIQEKIKETDQEGRATTWTQWMGSFHLILLHFPIALINMLAISEVLFAFYRKPLFEFASRFMLISAAIIGPLTALLGLIYSYSASYEGLMETFLWWHMWFGISTAAFTAFVAFLRKSREGIQNKDSSTSFQFNCWYL